MPRTCEVKEANLKNTNKIIIVYLLYMRMFRVSSVSNICIKIEVGKYYHNKFIKLTAERFGILNTFDRRGGVLLLLLLLQLFTNLRGKSKN